MATLDGSASGTRRRATIDDVARAAGVSRQTVSNVLRGQGRLGPATRRRVLDAVAELDYAPHPGASSMRTRRTAQLAHPMAAVELDPGNIVGIEFLQALVRAAADRDHHVLLSASERDDHGELAGLIGSARVDAVVFANLEPEDPRVAIVAARRFPFACFGRVSPGLPQNWVDVDNVAGVRRAVDHVRAAGHTDIAFLGYRSAAYWDRERVAGYRSAVGAAGLAERVALTRNTPSEIARTVSALLDARAAPTAVVCGSDTLAAAVYAAAGRVGRRIGRDLAVTGFDGSLIGRSVSPPLCTLVIPVLDIARRVVDRALREIEVATGGPGELIELELSEGLSV